MTILMRPWGHMNFVDQGPKDGPVIVFANSLGTDLRMWQAVADQLPYRTLRFDQRGHGLSATPAQDWGVEDVADDVAALMDHLTIDQAVIAGCSVGGMVAQAFGIHHPSRARALILSNTAAKIGTAEGWQARIDAVAENGIAPIADQILDRWFAAEFRASDAALPWQVMLRRTDPLGYVQTCKALARADLRPGVAQLTKPVLLIAGTEDQATPPALVTETANMIPGAQYILLQGSGHIPAIDAPETTARTIAEFLKGQNV